MNKEQVVGNWSQFKGKIKEVWGKMTDDDIALYNGKAEQFYGKLQEKCGVTQEDAERRLRELEESTGYNNRDNNRDQAA